MERVRQQAEKFGAEVRASQEVDRIDVAGAFFALRTGEATIQAHSVVVAAGSVYRRLGVPGEESLLGRGVSFCATCDAPFYRNLPLVVAGGGNSALQETVHLANFASRITVVQNLDRLTGSRVLEDRVRSLPNVEILLSHRVTEVLGDKAVQGVVLEDVAEGKTRTLAVDGLFVFIGLAPNTGFLQGFLELDAQGFVVTDPKTLAASVPGVFAAGDARSGSSKQITTAVGEGTIAAFMVQKWLADRNRCELHETA